MTLLKGRKVVGGLTDKDMGYLRKATLQVAGFGKNNT